MGQLEQSMADYRAIFDHDDFTAPFVEFVTAVRSMAPSPDEMTQVSSQSRRMLGAIADVRRVTTYHGGGNAVPYFRGSGIVVAGDSEGLVAVDYQSSGITEGFDDTRVGDPVADRYPSYQHVALEKVAKGALIYHIMLRSNGITMSGLYGAVNEILVANGLQDAEVPHHLGYAQYGSTGLVAGASGMLPSKDQDEQMRRYHAGVVDQDTARGWVEWPGDYFAGFHDKVAADSVLSTYHTNRTILHIGHLVAGENVH